MGDVADELPFRCSLAVHRRDFVFIMLQASTLISATVILFLARKYRGMACETHAHLLSGPSVLIARDRKT